MEQKRDKKKGDKNGFFSPFFALVPAFFALGSPFLGCKQAGMTI
nr:hypothetical protein [Mucilaginibacter sp. L294]